MTLQKQLIDARVQNGLALRLIAIRAGLAPSTVTRIAKGKTADVLASTHQSIVAAISELSTQPTPARARRTRAAATPKPTTKSSTAGRSKSRGGAGVGNK